MVSWYQGHSRITPPLSRFGVYGHKITNQIPPFSRSDTTCSNAAKIDSIQRWTLCHELVEFSAVRSRAALSAPRASRAPYHTPCNFSPTCISDTQFNSQFAWLDPRPSIFYFYFLFSINSKKKIQNFKLKKKSHFILCFACILFLFIFVSNIKTKKKRKEKTGIDQ